MRRPPTILLAAVLLLLLMPGRARADDCASVQEVAAAFQYCEVLTGPDGEGLPTEGERTSRLGDVLSPTLVRAFERAGPEGVALLYLPTVAPLRRGANGEVEPTLDPRAAIVAGDLASPPEDLGPGIVARVAQAVTGGGGVGEGLRWSLVISTLALFTLAWLRMHRGPEPLG